MIEETRILLADPQPLYRRGLKALLKDVPYWRVVGDASRTGELTKQFQLQKPHLLIIDYHKAFFDEEAIVQMLSEHSDCKVILISSRAKDWTNFNKLQFPVHSYLTKECSIQDVIKTIEMAIKGEKFYCNFIVELLLKGKVEKQLTSVQISDCLTEREIEITRMVALGKVNKEIASDLHLSPHTIHTHRKNIMKKLGLHSAVELTSYAKEVGII